MVHAAFATLAALGEEHTLVLKTRADLLYDAPLRFAAAASVAPPAAPVEPAALVSEPKAPAAWAPPADTAPSVASSVAPSSAPSAPVCAA